MTELLLHQLLKECGVIHLGKFSSSRRGLQITLHKQTREELVELVEKGKTYRRVHQISNILDI